MPEKEERIPYTIENVAGERMSRQRIERERLKIPQVVRKRYLPHKGRKAKSNRNGRVSKA